MFFYLCFGLGVFAPPHPKTKQTFRFLWFWFALETSGLLWFSKKSVSPHQSKPEVSKGVGVWVRGNSPKPLPKPKQRRSVQQVICFITKEERTSISTTVQKTKELIVLPPQELQWVKKVKINTKINPKKKQ